MHTFRSQLISVGAGEGNRTLVCSLGSCRSTIELRPHSCAMIELRAVKVHVPAEPPDSPDAALGFRVVEGQSFDRLGFSRVKARAQFDHVAIRIAHEHRNMTVAEG